MNSTSIGTTAEITQSSGVISTSTQEAHYWFINQPIIEDISTKVVTFFSAINPANALEGVMNGFTNTITGIWLWILYNLISPLLVIVFVILFFVGQYYLIKLYIKLFEYIGLNMIKLFNFMIQSKFIKKVITEFESV